MISQKIKVFSPDQMKKIGWRLAKEVLAKEIPIVLSLEGDLGSGKTTFLQGFARGLGVREEVTSPTFLIFKKYKTEKGRFFYHFDAYRVEEKDLCSLGIREKMSSKKNIVAIEWGEKVKKILPYGVTTLHFTFISSKERELIVKDNSGIISDSFLEWARSSAG